MKGRLNGKMIQIAGNPSPFEKAEAHLVETMFYNKWAPFGESLVSKLQGTFVPKWDIQDNPKLNLMELLMRKIKRKEVSTSELNNNPRCVRV